jgi:HlyD family secretion protein
MKLVPAKTTPVPAPLMPRSWYDDVPRATKTHKVLGYTAVAITVLGFGLWANVALISGAIVATGLFVTTGQNKVVQHLEGGVIKDILVREGDIVEPGQVLVRLDDTTPRAELRRLAIRNVLNTAKTARYMAEIQGDRQVDFPTDLAPKSAGLDIRDIDEIIDTQRLAFDARRKNVDTQIAALADAITGLQQRIDAGGLQEQSVKQQVELIREEFASKSTLLPGG